MINYRRKYYCLLILILILGIVGGLLFTGRLNVTSQEFIIDRVNGWLVNIDNWHYSGIILNVVILVTTFFSTKYFIGIPILFTYIFYQGFTLGFFIYSIILTRGLKIVPYFLIYFGITKFLFLILLIIYGVCILNIGYNICKKIFNKEKLNYNKTIILAKKGLLLILLIFINDIILYFAGNKILNFFNFLIK